MTLREFLRNETRPKELCVVRDSGYIMATCWIDYEDLFTIHPKFADMEVKRDEWGYLDIVNENNSLMQIRCHYIDI